MQWAGGPKTWWIFDIGIEGKLGEKKTEVQQNSGGSRKRPDERDWGPNESVVVGLTDGLD